MLHSYTMVDFHLFYDGVVDIQVWALLEVSVKSLILRWPLRPVGLLFFKHSLLKSNAVVLHLSWSFLCVLFRINNCVGEENHYAFMQLLFWAFCLSWMAFWSLMLHYWYYPACVTCDKVSMLFFILIWAR